MVKDYEELRSQVLNRIGHGSCVPGLTLFIRQGMCGWIRARSQHSSRPPAVTTPVEPGGQAVVPSGIVREVVVVLAAMVLGKGLGREYERGSVPKGEVGAS
jgi:hypothetical protein